MIGRHSRRGVVNVEFAICCSVVLALMAAIIDFGTYFAARHAIGYGAYKAARLAATQSSTVTSTSATAAVIAVVTPMLGAVAAKQCSVTISYPNGNVVGGTVVVGVSFTWHSAFTIDALPNLAIAVSQTLPIEN